MRPEPLKSYMYNKRQIFHNDGEKQNPIRAPMHVFSLFYMTVLPEKN